MRRSERAAFLLDHASCSWVHACSNFDRFAVDPLLDLKQIGPILDRNDLRVADVSVRVATCGGVHWLFCPILH